MKKLFALLLIAVLSVVGLSSCLGGVEFELKFIVDGETYDTVKTSGKEIVKIPTDPTKDEYTFDGWYWDDEKWQKPFTANSLLDAPISSNMSVYAKWKENAQAHTHIPSDWITDTEATCKAEGAKHKECTECEEVLENSTIEKLTTHTSAEAVKENFVDSDCETEGSYNSVVYCSVCEAKLSSEAKTVEKKKHTPSDWIIDTEATCKVAGSKHKECTECEEVLETGTIEKLTTHTPAEAVKENFVDSDCENEGSYNSVVYCSVCGEKLLSEAKTVEKKKHVFDQKDTDSRYLQEEASYTASAIYYYSCSCGECGTETFTYGEPLTQQLPITEEEFLNIVNISLLRNFTLNATISREYVYYDVVKNTYTVQTITDQSVSYANNTKYLYDCVSYYTFESLSISPYTETSSETSGSEFRCIPLEYGGGDTLGPKDIYGFLSYSNLTYDAESGVYTVVPTQTAIKPYQTTWYVEKLEFTVKNGKIETYRMSTCRIGNIPGSGSRAFNFTFDFEFSNIGTTKVPGYVYSDSPSLTATDINKLICGTSNMTGIKFKNFTLTTTISSNSGTFVEIDEYDGCMHSVNQTMGSAGEYSHDVDCTNAPNLYLMCDVIYSLTPSKLKLVFGSENEYLYSESLKFSDDTFTNIRLIIENGHIKSFSYETKSGVSVSYVFTNVGTTVVKCPEC